MNTAHPGGVPIALYPPSMTTALVVAIAVVFAMTWIAGGPGDIAVILSFGANFGPLVAAGEIWRLVASMFLHANVLHLAVNAYALYFLGRNLEAFYGRWAFLFLYLFAGVVGSIASATLSQAISLGASGGIFGLLGASIVFAFRYRGVLPPRVTKIMGTALLPWVVLNLAFGFLIPHIDMNAHVGGLVGGAIIAFVVPPRALQEARGMHNPSTTRSLASVSLALLLVTTLSAAENLFRMRGPDGPLLDARVLAVLGQVDRDLALRDVNEALAKNPDDASMLMLRAQLRTIGEEWFDAIHDYQRVLELDPGNALAANNLAWVLLEEAPEELRNWTEAERLASNALHAAPEDPYVLGTYGTVRLRRGDFDGAVNYLRRALEAERPTFDESTDRYLLAIALAKRGDVAEAVEVLEEALREDPENAYRREARSAVGIGENQSDPSL